MGDTISLNTRILLATRVFMVERWSKEDLTRPRGLGGVEVRGTCWIVGSFSSRPDEYL
jgi:hypothetical protein